MPGPDVIYGDNQWLSMIADGIVPIDKTSFTTGSKNGLGGTAEPMTISSYPLRRGVVVKASSVNAGRVYVGDSVNVTQNTDANMDGFELSAGESIFLPLTNINLVYLVASQSGQKVFWWGI